MKAHTPGPWIASDWVVYAKGNDFNPLQHGEKTCQECGHDESGCYDFAVITAVSVALIRDIKNGHWNDFKKSEETSKADMRLIAAAPDLLKALQDLCDTLGKCKMTKQARVAIAKAKRGAL